MKNPTKKEKLYKLNLSRQQMSTIFAALEIFDWSAMEDFRRSEKGGFRPWARKGKQKK